MSGEVKGDIIVVGAGAIGAACALKIAQQNTSLTVVVIERQAKSTASDNGNIRVWALAAAATDLLRELEVFDELGLGHCHHYSKMMVWDENSDGELSFDAADYDADSLGYMVDAERCTHLLQDKLIKQANIETYFATDLDSIDFSAGAPRLSSNSQSFTADLVIAADGANSWVRQQAGIFAPANSYAQTGLVAKIFTEQAHEDTAWQRFLSTGPVAVLPLAQNYSSIVWSCSNDLSRELLALTEEQFEHRLQLSLDNRLGSISLKSKLFSFALQSRQAEFYTKQGLALIGDAAHNIHPLAGQGANLGFKDVLELASQISQFDTVNNPKLLATYQRKRRADNLQTDLLMTSLHHAYRLNLPIWSLVRGMGMSWISNNKPIKTQLARQAMGLKSK